MALPQSIASTRVVGPIRLRDAPGERLVRWPRKRACFRAKPRAESKRSAIDFSKHSARIPSPTHSFNAALAAPLRFPTTLSQPQPRGWSGNFGVHNEKEWVREG
jgi:hypothetical protein